MLCEGTVDEFQYVHSVPALEIIVLLFLLRLVLRIPCIVMCKSAFLSSSCVCAPQLRKEEIPSSSNVFGLLWPKMYVNE